MGGILDHILVADVGGTNTGIAIFADRGQGRFEPLRHRSYRSKLHKDIPSLLSSFLRSEARGLEPKVRRACIDFAGPVGRDRNVAEITNLGWGFTARQVFEATGVEELTLLNDFEAVGFGLEVLLRNRPETFVRLSSHGRLPGRKGIKPTAVVIGAGTGLGTTILVQDSSTGRYRPVPGEGGHADFVAVDEEEFRVAQWIRKNVNRSSKNPVDCEKVVSGPGLIHVFRALSELEPELANRKLVSRILQADPYDRPAWVVRKASSDPLCRKSLDLWLRCYARAAKNYAIFPLTPGGIFLAGGIAAKILPELQSGLFMREFTRCDIPGIRALLRETPIFVVTDYRIGLYGCANVAANFYGELGLKRGE
jgi:glucokinase